MKYGRIGKGERPGSVSGLEGSQGAGAGALPAGEGRTIVWHVTPVRAGSYTVHYEVAAGLDGKAKAVTSDGGPVRGPFRVDISTKVPRTCVTGAGQVVTRCGG